MEACKAGVACLNTSSILLKNTNPVTIEITDANISKPSFWKLKTPNAFPINIPPGGEIMVGKELKTAATQAPVGGQIRLTLNDGSIFIVH